MVQRLIRLLDDPDAVIESSEWDDWSVEFIQACQEAGLLSPCTKHARFIRCPGCDDPHDVEVRTVWFCKVQRLIAVCSTAGVQPIPPSNIERWRPSLSGLAKLIADSLGIECGLQSTHAGDAGVIGHVVRNGKAIRVCIARSKAQFKQIIQPGVHHAIVVLKPLADAQTINQATVMQAADLINWDVREGVTVNVDLIRALLNLSPDESSGLASRDGFDGKRTLVLSGTTHRCPSMKPQLNRLLSVLATKAVVPITEIVHEGEDAVWRRLWDPKDKKQVGAIRTTLNELKNKLCAAAPPVNVHFKLELKWEHISRTARR